ncbi:MAG: diguanylate cyclase [Fimbriimonadaceae bacterium]|nr:diguanylate cyclase [Fimbriimonadaceae bacterium]
METDLPVPAGDPFAGQDRCRPNASAESDLRIHRLTQAVRSMRKGDFERAIADSTGTDELGDLTVEVRRLAGWLNARFAEMDRLMEVAEQVAHGMFLDDVLQRTYESFKPLIPYDRIGCALLSEDGASLTAYWARTEYAAPMLTGGYTGAMAGSSLEHILKTGRPRIINDLEAYLREHPNSESTKVVLAEGVRSSLTCPLITDDHPIGFLFFSSCQKNTYRDLHQDVFLKIAGQLSALIERSRLYQRIWKLNEELQVAHRKIADQAARDPLTGVLNHGAVLDVLEMELHDPDGGTPPGVIMADVDHFKSVNDRLGHLAGDEVLRRVADAIQGCLRSTDSLGRYGGEEFLVVLPGASDRTTRRVAERIRLAVEGTPVEVGGDVVRVTISLGVALPEAHLQANASERIGVADKALYAAKHAGRNRVCVRGLDAARKPAKAA